MISPADFCSAAIARLREQIPGRCVVAASGGIDSTVAAVLTHRAVGDRAEALFVDTGLLREGELDRVRQIFAATGIRYDVVDGSDRFFAALEGVT
ncbi:GMP synthase, large subunit, partial [mine drainage metagenome]